ncbi:unnamed protein product [Rotaria sordida]|uniref:Uncharacterized protein n=1 Tax=Rotaria sordida TaxID=392033 RepID=A0A814FSF7_9BILA|nr:unnamed protein product [Rotaria sordida]CAF0986118.1 unnamed protein product [Rotaria sordida]
MRALAGYSHDKTLLVFIIQEIIIHVIEENGSYNKINHGEFDMNQLIATNIDIPSLASYNRKEKNDDFNLKP